MVGISIALDHYGLKKKPIKNIFVFKDNVVQVALGNRWPYQVVKFKKQRSFSKLYELIS
jgi:hypothetical protein